MEVVKKKTRVSLRERQRIGLLCAYKGRLVYCERSVIRVNENLTTEVLAIDVTICNEFVDMDSKFVDVIAFSNELRRNCTAGCR